MSANNLSEAISLCFLDTSLPLTSGSQVMGFVKHSDIPLLRKVPECISNIGLLCKVDRCDDTILLHPRILRGMCVLLGLNKFTVIDYELLAEFLAELLLPLLLERRRGDNENAVGTISSSQLLNDHRCLDSLPEPYLVGNQIPVIVR
ncbi:hypothetical protein SAMN06264867_11215 [Halorubrum cibi]|uniref:Uncharacterized protein n=1 Tax=Halorubrum cibi TaxID=413815 RepID=A0A521EQ32_9EURY|nr:hypothetical protein SAMN06264867_11215 [Halorubrum cibi]